MSLTKYKRLATGTIVDGPVNDDLILQNLSAVEFAPLLAGDLLPMLSAYLTAIEIITTGLINTDFRRGLTRQPLDQLIPDRFSAVALSPQERGFADAIKRLSFQEDQSFVDRLKNGMSRINGWRDVLPFRNHVVAVISDSWLLGDTRTPRLHGIHPKISFALINREYQFPGDRRSDRRLGMDLLLAENATPGSNVIYNNYIERGPVFMRMASQEELAPIRQGIQNETFRFDYRTRSDLHIDRDGRHSYPPRRRW
jgi:hypothetical protein